MINIKNKFYNSIKIIKNKKFKFSNIMLYKENQNSILKGFNFIFKKELKKICDKI